MTYERQAEMKLYKSNYYLIEKTPGLSGFQQWDKVDRFIVTGYKAQHERAYVTHQFNPTFVVGNITCQLEDGHLRDCQPVVSLRKALDWLDENKFSLVYIGTYPKN